MLLQIGHGLDRLLDRRLAIDAVAVVEIDSLDAQSLQALLARLLAVLGRGVDLTLHVLTLAYDLVGELRGEEDVVPLAGLEEPVALLPLCNDLKPTSFPSTWRAKTRSGVHDYEGKNKNSYVPFSDQIFRIAVHVGRVPEGLAQLVRAVQDLESLLVRLGFSIKRAQAHQTEAESWDRRAVLPELAGRECGCHCDCGGG